MTTSKNVLFQEAIIKLNNEYTGAYFNIEQIKDAIENHADKSVIEIVHLGSGVSEEYETEINTVIAEFKGEANEVEAITDVSAEEVVEITINKRTAKKINRVFGELVDAMDGALDGIRGREDDSLSVRVNSRKQIATQEEIEAKKEKELSNYLIEKEILSQELFLAHLTKENKERFEDLECTFLQLLDTVAMYLY